MAEHDVTEAMVADELRIASDNAHRLECACDEAIPDDIDAYEYAMPVCARCQVIARIDRALAALAARTTPIAGSEPVAYMRRPKNNGWDVLPKLSEERSFADDIPLYTHPTGSGADADWVLVPREPTQHMLNMVVESLMREGSCVGSGCVKEWWQMMLVSSPQQRAPHPPSVRESAGEGK